MKLCDLKPSSGLTRLWIGSILLIFVLSHGADFRHNLLVGFLSHIGDFFYSVVWEVIDLLQPTSAMTINELNDHNESWRGFVEGVTLTLTYVVVSIMIFLLFTWIKVGFAKNNP